jgi:uncharacterized membrane protein YsdA (DUF1294 family)
LLGAAGGTPAAYAAQQLFRHKTRKKSFMIRVRIICVCQIAILATWMWWSRHRP